MGFTVASHNIMHGVFLDDLIRRYEKLANERPFDILCLQENVACDPAATALSGKVRQSTHADLIASALVDFRAIWLPESPALATLVRRRLEVQESFLIPLPRLAQLNWFERLYIRGGKTKQKYAQVTRATDGGQALCIVNFHLDTAGNNQHRQAQVRAVADTLVARGITQRIVACGDTNAFTWHRRQGHQVTAQLMAPLHAIGSAACQGNIEATHYFARQREALLTHRLMTLLGRLGLDHPLPYDVICTDLPVSNCDKVTTEESDHDLVFAQIDWPGTA